MFYDALSVDSAAACAELSSRGADILAIAGSPELGTYLERLFEPSGWTISRVSGWEAAYEFLRGSGAAVAVCEETLPDGGWRDVALLLDSLQNPPALVVAGDGGEILGDVLEQGGFDALHRPLRDTDVVWSVASAWHEWMNRFQIGSGGARCGV